MSDIYKIGVALMLTQNGIAPALSALSHQLIGIHRSVGQINSGFGRWRTALVGVAGIMAGSGIIGGLGKIAEHGKELLNQQDQLIRAGRTHAEVANMTAEAYQKITKAVPTATGSDVLRTVRELTMVLGDPTHAMQAAPTSLKLEALLGNATGKKAEGQGYSFWRAVEEKGGTQLPEAERDALMGKMLAGSIASGGKWSGSDWFTFAKRAGVSWLNMSPEMMSIVPTLGQSMGADTAGTAMMTATQTILGATTLRKQQFDAFKKLGLIDPTKVHSDHGHINMDLGAIKGSNEYGNNLWGWSENILSPALANSGLSPAEQDAIKAKMFPNRNANRIFSAFTNPLTHGQFVKDTALQGQALGLNEGYNNFITKNPKGVEEAYEKQKDSMLQAIGAPMMQMAIPIMQAVTTMFNNIGAFAQSHPDAIKIIAGGLAALGAVLVAAGGVALLAAFGVGGGLAAGFAAAGAAVAAFLLYWDKLVKAINNIGNAVGGSMVGKWLGFGNGTTAPPASTSPGNGDMSGDVYFDSDKVGRWMGKAARRLSEHSIVGPALFDPATAATPNDSAFAIP